MILPAPLLAQLASALERPSLSREFPTSRWRTVRERGWGYRSDVEDIVNAMESRMYGVQVVELAVLVGFPMRDVRDRPMFVEADWTAMPAMTAVDLAGFVIFLERLGFSVEPGPMVESLLGKVSEQSIMTISEALIFSFSKLRHREQFALWGADSPSGEAESKRWQSEAGYHFDLIKRGDVLSELVVTGSKFRARRVMEVDCSLCGIRYDRCDRESAYFHRQTHRKLVRLFSPVPLNGMRDRLRAGIDGERVDSRSPYWMHQAVYDRARQFKREFGYDTVQWPSRRREADQWVGYLFADPSGAIDGACAFYLDAGEWALQWVWLRPEARRKGLLAQRWPAFLNEFGNFWIEHPLSNAMQAFVGKCASHEQRRLIADRSRNSLD